MNLEKQGKLSLKWDDIIFCQCEHILIEWDKTVDINSIDW
jgi:hypothetical protein